MPETFLVDALEDYRKKVNENPRICRMIEGWEPCIVLHAYDTDESYSVSFHGGLIGAIKRGKQDEAEHLIEIDGKYDELFNIFTGKTNPAQSFLKGDINVFANDKDQTKLDAISLVLWGI